VAFENNQQDAFNLRNNTESLKKLEAELDKATTAIGAAEMAAEEELAALKLKNIAIQQNARLKKLDELIKQEEAGIRELATLRLKLSEKQFNVRKQEIQKELQLTKEAIEELRKTANKKFEPSAEQTTPSKNNYNTPAKTEKASKATILPETQDELLGLVRSIDATIRSLHDTATTFALAKEKRSSSENIPRLQTLQNTQDPVKKPQTETVEEAIGNIYSQQNAYTNPTQSSENNALAVLFPLIQSIDNTLGSFDRTICEPLDYIRMRINWISEDALACRNNLFDLVQLLRDTEDDQQASTAKDIQNSTNTETDANNSNGDSGVDKESGEKPIEPKTTNNYSNYDDYDDEVNIGKTSLEDIVNGIDPARKAFGDRANENPMIAALEKLKNLGEADRAAVEKAEKEGKEPPKPKLSQDTLDIGGELLKSMEASEASRQKIQEKLLESSESKKLRRELSTLKAKADRDKKYQDEYYERLEEAGDYAVSLEEYKADAERKRQKQAKKEAVGGMTDALKKFGSGEFSMVDFKNSYGDYMNKRTAELEADGLNDKSAKLNAAFELAAEAANSLAKALDSKVKDISKMQGIVDTRLQGSQTNERDFGNGSYWNQLLEDAKKIAGASPFISQEKLVDNIKALVEKGISFDIKQRAFLMTIQEKIANTFEVADGTLLRLIRIQQQDTTAGRLGMESALNSFLNSMYETSEYLESVAKSVRGSLEEMQALMEGKDATELEYQVQKWMGSLYSVGMSDKAVQDIASTFGQIASGDISGLSGNGTGNLLIMAANEAGMSIADILQDGLKADETNKLMQAMVNYLAEIAESSSDSRVVQQQLANVYGIKASDLRAATNLSASLKDVAKEDKSYFGMMLRLNNMMNTIRFRTSIGEGMTNMWDNMMYSMASTQASNPILYLLPKMANILNDVTSAGGIDLPFINVSGFGVDLNTSVADLMLVASMAGTALGSLGSVVTGIADLVNPLAGTTMLIRAGINPLDGAIRALTRGTPSILQNTGGNGLSESGQLVANSDGNSIKEQTMQGAEDDKKKQMVEAKEEESADDVIAKGQQAIIDIYNLLEEVAHGSQSLRVRVVNNNGSIASFSSPDGDVHTDTTKNTDNGNWVLAF
jgi:hypothetical protein